MAATYRTRKSAIKHAIVPALGDAVDNYDVDVFADHVLVYRRKCHKASKDRKRKPGFAVTKDAAAVQTAFVLADHKWDACEGLPIEERATWHSLRFAPAEAAKWLADFFTAAVADRWRKSGFEPEEARVWRRKGVMPQTAALIVQAAATSVR